MTDCCLLVCLRPSHHTRVVGRLYPRNTTGMENDLKPSGVSAAFAAGVPGKSDLSGRAVARARRGFTRKGKSVRALRAFGACSCACAFGLPF